MAKTFVPRRAKFGNFQLYLRRHLSVWVSVGLACRGRQIRTVVSRCAFGAMSKKCAIFERFLMSVSAASIFCDLKELRKFEKCANAKMP